MGMKYVILKSRGFAFPIIFPDKLVHEDVANAILNNLKEEHKDPNATIFSAGEVFIEPSGVTGIYHGSKTLNIESSTEQAGIDLTILRYPDTLGYIGE